jgi:hypothetical protein
MSENGNPDPYSDDNCKYCVILSNGKVKVSIVSYNLRDPLDYDDYFVWDNVYPEDPYSDDNCKYRVTGLGQK